MGSTQAVGSRFQQPASIWVRRWFIKQILSMVNPAPLRLVSVYVASLKTWPPACKRRVEPAVCEIRPMILLLVFCLRQGGPSSSMESTLKIPLCITGISPQKELAPMLCPPDGVTEQTMRRQCPGSAASSMGSSMRALGPQENLPKALAGDGKLTESCNGDGWIMFLSGSQQSPQVFSFC